MALCRGASNVSPHGEEARQRPWLVTNDRRHHRNIYVMAALHYVQMWRSSGAGLFGAAIAVRMSETLIFGMMAASATLG